MKTSKKTNTVFVACSAKVKPSAVINYLEDFMGSIGQDEIHQAGYEYSLFLSSSTEDLKRAIESEKSEYDSHRNSSLNDIIYYEFDLTPKAVFKESLETKIVKTPVK